MVLWQLDKCIASSDSEAHTVEIRLWKKKLIGEGLDRASTSFLWITGGSRGGGGGPLGKWFQ